MAFSWLAYLDHAKAITAGQPDEAAVRSAISRAYYAVYNGVRVYASVAWAYRQPENESSHKALWRCVSADTGNHLRRRLAQHAKNLKAARESADYDGHATMSPGRAKNVIDEASRALDVLRDIQQAKT